MDTGTSVTSASLRKILPLTIIPWWAQGGYRPTERLSVPSDLYLSDKHWYGANAAGTVSSWKKTLGTLEYGEA